MLWIFYIFFPILNESYGFCMFTFPIRIGVLVIRKERRKISQWSGRTCAMIVVAWWLVHTSVTTEGKSRDSGFRFSRKSPGARRFQPVSLICGQPIESGRAVKQCFATISSMIIALRLGCFPQYTQSLINCNYACCCWFFRLIRRSF